MATVAPRKITVRTRTRRRPPQAAGFDRHYWLRHCEGFRVDGAEGRLGFVDSIRDPDGRDPLLAVRAGALGRRLLLIRAKDVAFVVPREARIWLTSRCEIVGSEAP